MLIKWNNPLQLKQEYITKILCPKIALRSASKIEM